VTGSNNTSQYISMDMTIGAVWFAIALVFIAMIIFNMVAIRRTISHPPRSSRPPPHVNFAASIGLLHTLFTKGFQEMVFEQCKKLGSVFTVSLVGKKLTFLVGPEVSGQFYQGLDSEVSLNLYEFTVPILGKDVGYSVDSATRYEQRAVSGLMRSSRQS
jgi:sterol 14alpha-demethylase